MLSDRVWRGALHHIMTIGGRRATPASTAQLHSEFSFAARPAINTAETQTVATTALSDASCISEEYAPALNGAAPKCTDRRDADGERQAPVPDSAAFTSGGRNRMTGGVR